MLRPILSTVCLLLLAGCKFEAGFTTVTNVAIDGHAVNATRSYVQGSHGEFECMRSASGHCHYVLFVDECRAGGAGAADGCEVRTVQAFTLAAGETQRFGELPRGLRQCVDHHAPPVAPDCATL